MIPPAFVVDSNSNNVSISDCVGGEQPLNSITRLVFLSQCLCGRAITVLKCFVCRGVAGIDVLGTLLFELSIGEICECNYLHNLGILFKFLVS